MIRSALAVLLVCVASPLLAEEADWYPSRVGADDRIGAANHLSPEIVKAAAGLVTTGKTYSLGMEVAQDTPAYPPRRSGRYTGPAASMQRMSKPTALACAGSRRRRRTNQWLCQAPIS